MKIGIIGGSGMEKWDILNDVYELKNIETPYGNPSSKIKVGNFKGSEVYIISRHGENHEITPTHVNNRANIYSFIKLECKYVIATTAAGSLKENVAPGDFVIIDQFIDFTKFRKNTFYDNFKNGIKHESMADPFSKTLRQYLINSCEELNLKHHKKGTVITIEGPRFSTRAESFMFRNYADIINMSTAPEAILAKEAGLEYAAIAMSTDYDCWKTHEKPVTWEEVLKVMSQNSENVKKILINTLEKISLDETKNNSNLIKNKIRTIPNFPKLGIMFRDLTTLFKDKEGLKKTTEIFYERYKNNNINLVAGIESRGFIFGGILASKLGCGFVPIRKKGKLPYETISQDYELEYGTDSVEIHRDSIKLEDKVLLVDDLIATGGTALASAKLIEKLGGKIEEIAFIVELSNLKGRKKLKDYKVFSIAKFEGE